MRTREITCDVCGEPFQREVKRGDKRTICSLRCSVMRFLRRDKKTGCLVWVGAVNSGGYGELSFRGEHHLAFHVAYYLDRGQWPNTQRRKDGRNIDVHHTCGNRRCCEPGHLTITTHAENCRMRETL